MGVWRKEATALARSLNSFWQTLTAFLLLAAFAASAARGQAAYEHEPILYNTAPVTDPVARLQAKLDAGETKLEFDPAGAGYLRSLLRKLHVPVSSQTLVFSKTSLQRNGISPQTPRALYFDDEVYVGWVRNGEMLEIASTDPDLGPVFYTLDQRPNVPPKFVRQADRCTQCHAGTMTGDVPGLMIRSVHPDPYGMPVLTAGTSLTTQNSPLEDRWGGWYVTGTHGERRHKGNVTAKHRDDAGPLDVEAGANLLSLTDRFDTTPYPGGGHSDIVALMVLEHQAEAHNLITRLNYQARWAMRDSEAINGALGGTSGADAPLTDSARRRISSAGEKLVRYLLYCDEELLGDRIAGTSTFAADFASRGPRDRQGRSLRDFDLRKRIFRHPLSYLIYSPSFDHLPAPAKDYVYRRLWEILSGEDTGRPFKHLSTLDRRAVVEILRDTKPDLPAYFGGTK
jgi:hypothetical protein